MYENVKKNGYRQFDHSSTLKLGLVDAALIWGPAFIELTDEIYLSIRFSCKDLDDHRNFIHNFTSCEIKTGKKIFRF